MNSKRVGVWLALCITMVAALPAAAAEKPINISLFPPICLAKPADGVTAFRLSVYGNNTSVKMVDIGFVNQTTTSSNGLQWGVINYNESASNGFQFSAINYDKGAAGGLQAAAGFNFAGTESGLQIAVVNYAEKLEGFQLGVINIAKAGGKFPFMIIANWKK